jgi:succinyl-CoA synthetase alpha subunit
LTACSFLETGGKATSATIVSSVRAVLVSERVNVLFVNIFGGLTKCEMIAEGNLLAYKEVGVKVPVVVRLRGANEELGRQTLEKGCD